MTREEAIRELKIFSGTTRLRLSANFWTALNKSIKALEARDKMIEDIENINDTIHDGTNHFYKTAEDIKTEGIDIINKHLGEVEE